MQTLDYTEEALPIPLDRSAARARVVAAHAPPVSHVDPLLHAPSIVLDGPALVADARARALRRLPTAPSDARMRESLYQEEGDRRRGVVGPFFLSVAAVAIASLCAGYGAAHWIAPLLSTQLVP